MANKVNKIFPDCSCCGKTLERKSEILPGYVLCPICNNDHYFASSYDQEILEKLSIADKKRNNNSYDEAYIHYDIIANENPKVIEAYWGLFLSSFGVVYKKNESSTRYLPTINQHSDESPLNNQNYLRVLQLTTDKHMRKNFLSEAQLIEEAWSLTENKVKRNDKGKVSEKEIVIKPVFKADEFQRLETKVVGDKIPDDYKINPIIENKIATTIKIYLKARKYNRAIKAFDQIILAEPSAKAVWWNKSLAVLKVTDIKELPPEAKLDKVFDLYDELFNLLTKKEAEYYLNIIIEHLFIKLKEASEFDQEIYYYIMKWKTVNEQNEFANLLYEQAHIKLNQEGLATVSWIHDCLETATRYIPKQDSRFIKKYVDTSIKINKLGYYEDAMILADIVLDASPKHREMNILQLCASYKVPELKELNLALNDLKFIDFLKDSITHKYKVVEFFYEIELAINRLISAKKYKFAIELIEIYIKYLPNSEAEVLNRSLLIFSSNLIYQSKFKEALPYVKMIIENNPKNKEAHWAKLKIELRAHSNFFVLLKAKKELMKYPDFDNALNCTSDNREYILFYEIHDNLNKAITESKIQISTYRRNFKFFDSQCNRESIKTFTNTLYPQMKIDAHKIFEEQRKIVVNVVNRSVVIILIALFSFLMSSLRHFFDPRDTINPIIVSYNILLFFRDKAVFIITPSILLIYAITWIRISESLLKGLQRGLLWGLTFATIFMATLWGIPWVLARFLTTQLFSVSAFISAVPLFLLSGTSTFFILKQSQKKLKEVCKKRKTKVLIMLNVISLVVFWMLSLTAVAYVMNWV